MANTSVSIDVSEEAKTALVAFFDALALAEPIQAKLWQLAEITLTQAQVLRALRDRPQTLGKLGESIGLSPTSITRVVDRLERRGLVSRRRDSDDRRLVQLQLEPAGQRLMGEIRVIRGSDIHLAIEAMSSDERTQLTDLLRRLVELAPARNTEEHE